MSRICLGCPIFAPRCEDARITGNFPPFVQINGIAGRYTILQEVARQIGAEKSRRRCDRKRKIRPHRSPVFFYP